MYCLCHPTTTNWEYTCTVCGHPTTTNWEYTCTVCGHYYSCVQSTHTKLVHTNSISHTIVLVCIFLLLHVETVSPTSRRRGESLDDCLSLEAETIFFNFFIFLAPFIYRSLSAQFHLFVLSRSYWRYIGDCAHS